MKKQETSATLLRGVNVELNTYQFLASQTAIYPGKGEVLGLSYATLGLAGESGEIANKVKKIIRVDRTIENAKQDLKEEIGDVLWYIAAVADNLGLKLDDIAHENIRKLRSRQERGVLKGSGDNR